MFIAINRRTLSPQNAITRKSNHHNLKRDGPLTYAIRKKPTEMATFPLLFSFTGRISRRQFSQWWIPIQLSIILGYWLHKDLGLSLIAFALWPLMALTTKRYHDFGSNGLIGLLQFVPMFGWLAVIAGCCFTIGDYKDNKYGVSLYK